MGARPSVLGSAMQPGVSSGSCHGDCAICYCKAAAGYEAANQGMNMLRPLTALCVLVSCVSAQFRERLAKEHLPVHTLDVLQDLLAQDLDGDGNVDVLVACSGQNRLFRGIGWGRFEDISSRLPQGIFDTKMLLPGDIDGDGDLDLLHIATRSETRFFVNDGLGHWTDPLASGGVVFGNHKHGVLVDVDSDSDLDLVLTGQQSKTPGSLYLNDGSGSFTDVTKSHLPIMIQGENLVAEDFDRDGDTDILFVSEGAGVTQPVMLANNGSGVFSVVVGAVPSVTGPVLQVRVGDTDGDGDPDLLLGLGTGIRMWLNRGSGTFVEAPAGSVPNAAVSVPRLLLADADGDGDLDVWLDAVSIWNSKHLYLDNDGSGKFTLVTPMLPEESMGETLFWEAVDLDGDGGQDLITADDHRISILLSDRSGGFVLVNGHRLGVQISQSRFVDLTGDGYLDAIRDLDLLINNGRDEFAVERSPRVPVHVFLGGTETLDIEGDGDIDIATSLGILENNGAGFFALKPAGLPSRFPSLFRSESADVDADGDTDLVVTLTTLPFRDELRVYLNDGSGAFAELVGAFPALLPNSIGSIEFADVDNDGDADIGIALSSAGTKLLLNDGRGQFVDATSRLPALPFGLEAGEFGDVDGDGDQDWVLTGAQNYLLVNNGMGSFVDLSSRVPQPRTRGREVRLLDVELDGDLDIVVASTGIELLSNDGNGRFSLRSVVDHRNAGFLLSDLDGDGDTDMMSGQRIFINHLRQLEAPYLAKPGQSYRLEVYSQPGVASAPQLAGLLASVAISKTALEIPLLGTLRLDPGRLNSMPAVSIPTPAGRVDVDLLIPAQSSLVGQEFQFQALILRFPGTIRLTNIVADTIR